MLPKEQAQLLFTNVLTNAKKLGWKIYTDQMKLNIVGLRNNTKRSNRFDDILLVFRKVADQWEVMAIDNFTTDPGEYYLLSPMRTAGTAIFVPNVQVINSHKLMDNGHHKLRAFRQVKPFPHIRDNNRNTTLDFELFNDKTKWNTTEVISANIHPASQNNIQKYIGKYSAACQVVDVWSEWLTLVQWGDKQIEYYNDPFVSYGIMWLKDVAPQLATNV